MLAVKVLNIYIRCIIISLAYTKQNVFRKTKII